MKIINKRKMTVSDLNKTENRFRVISAVIEFMTDSSEKNNAE